MVCRTLCLLLLVGCSLAQQYGSNYVDDYDYQDAGPAPPRRAPAPVRPQSAPASRGPAPARPTPVPILKQINRHNEDGSYTYGYEAADGTFKIETKFSTGDVKGKYGFVDDTGKVRVVEYGADKFGFQPAGEGITVAPPTLVDETATEEAEEDLFQARPQFRPRPQPQPQLRPRPRPQQVFQDESYDVQTTFHQAPRPAPQPLRRPSAPRGPLPQRPAGFAGASPATGGVVYSQQPRPNRPVPSPLDLMQHAPRAGPGRAFSQPEQPRYEQPRYEQPAPAPRPAPQFQPRTTGGILDQLAKDYALPQTSGVTTLHDISFGYY